MAATGTPTPNLGLRRAQGTDPASVDDINYNSDLLDTKLGAVGGTSVQGQIDALSASTAQTFGNVQDGLAIVSNGNTHVAIPAGYWVYVKGHGTLSEGLYKNTSGATIAANATLSTSNLTADPDGGLNSVYNALNTNITNLSKAVYKTSYANLDSCSTLKEVMDAVDNSDSRFGEGNVGNMDSNSFKTLIGGAELSNFDRASVYRLCDYQYLVVASSNAANSKVKMKFLLRSFGSPTDESRMYQTSWTEI